MLANAQYSRHECLEAIGKPKIIESKDLEQTICKIFNGIGFDIGQGSIEVCHRLTNQVVLLLSFPKEKIAKI